MLALIRIRDIHRFFPTIFGHLTRELSIEKTRSDPPPSFVFGKNRIKSRNVLQFHHHQNRSIKVNVESARGVTVAVLFIIFICGRRGRGNGGCFDCDRSGQYLPIDQDLPSSPLLPPLHSHLTVYSLGYSSSYRQVTARPSRRDSSVRGRHFRHTQT